MAGLEALGNVERDPDAGDRRGRRIALTARGIDCLQASAAIFQRLHDRWASDLGATRMAALEDDLEAIAASAAGAGLGDLPGWLRG